MLTFIISIILIVAVLLVLIILAQNSKGGGLVSNISEAGQMMGARRTTDWIEKTTWVLAITVFLLSISTVVLVDKNDTNSSISSPNVDKAKEEGDFSLPPSNTPLSDNLVDSLTDDN